MKSFEIPETLTLDSAALFTVYLRLDPGGLSFSGYNTKEEGSYFFVKVVFDKDKPYLESLKDYFFSHEFLTYTYKKVFVIPFPSSYTLVPEEIYLPEEKEQILAFNFASKNGKALNNNCKESQVEIVFDIDRQVYEFCCRSLTNPQFIHPIRPLLRLWKKQSQNCLPKQMYVILQKESMDIACYERGQLLFANSFGFEHSEDIIYYILYVWKQIDMNQLIDQIRLTGEPTLCNQVLDRLQIYLQYIARIELPAETYTFGPALMQAPLDLIALATCES
ncbi:DUF3822 family protein [Parabacteroides sp. Marseille-P3160]|uniref:DUF3822 family protein n=1 Tax=Parabacteroides sp. Marseille-P3160 TaxID=1917887 RepID=UPI0009BB27A1|nr:DUF3822 family protein [Parabacteroides sp. Marseille-P3160]